MCTKGGVERPRNKAGECQKAGSSLLLCGLLAVVASAGVMGESVGISRASPLQTASADVGQNFLVLSLKESSAIAARIPQRTLSSRYDVVLKAGELAIPVPRARPAPKRVNVGKALRTQAACMTGGLFEDCPGFLDLLRSRQNAWPQFANAPLPDIAASLSPNGAAGVQLASLGDGLNLVTSNFVAAVDRPERRSGDVIVGAASTYNPYRADDNDAGGAETASGELYNPIGWTAAIQTDLRGEFDGVHYGRLYRPSFALVVFGGRRAIVKINDVGPLRPGRVIDLSTQAMHYFDPTLERGVLESVLVMPLVGSDWTAGPLGERPMVAMADNE